MTRPAAAAPDDRILERELSALTLGGAVLLDAVVRQSASGPVARLFFGSGSSAERLSLDPAGLAQGGTAELHNVGGAPVLEADLRAEDQPVTVRVDDGAWEVPLQRAETDLLAGLNVLAAVRNGESAEAAADWLRYHVSQHGMQAAVIIDRAAPQASRGFAAALRSLASGIAGLQRVIVVRCGLPLGKPGLPEEAHPFNVPGAPGKDRMEIPPADPWHAPLGEFLIYEILRSRFLGQARAVANIDLFDLLAPGEDNIFDRAVAAPYGLSAAGRRAGLSLAAASRQRRGLWRPHLHAV